MPPQVVGEQVCEVIESMSEDSCSNKTCTLEQLQLPLKIWGDLIHVQDNAVVE